MKLRTIATVDELVEHFEGLTKTGRVFGVSPQVVMRWRTRGALPARSFLVQKSILKGQGVEAPSYLWGIVEPERAA